MADWFDVVPDSPVVLSPSHGQRLMDVAGAPEAVQDQLCAQAPPLQPLVPQDKGTGKQNITASSQMRNHMRHMRTRAV
eukprot:3686057-Alexandrium_andersonii.AAC.1